MIFSKFQSGALNLEARTSQRKKDQTWGWGDAHGEREAAEMVRDGVNIHVYIVNTRERDKNKVDELYL